MMKHQVVLEFDPETGHYTATVPGMPEIIVDAKSEKAALKLVGEAIQIHGQSSRPSHVTAKVVPVDV